MYRLEKWLKILFGFIGVAGMQNEIIKLWQEGVTFFESYVNLLAQNFENWIGTYWKYKQSDYAWFNLLLFVTKSSGFDEIIITKNRLGSCWH